MENDQKINFIPTSLPTEIEKLENDKFKVKWQNQENKEQFNEDGNQNIYIN